jgi:hypothetical protein
MRKAKFAERLICPFVGKDRAAAMIGDLLETEPTAGRFWTSSVALLTHVTWRPCAALMLACASMCITWIPAFHGWVSISRHMWVQTGVTTTWAPNAGVIEHEAVWAYLLGCIAMLEGISAVFALVLYGFRDCVSIVSTALAALTLALCWYLSSPSIRTGMLYGLALLITIALLSVRESRRALVILVLATCASLSWGALMLKAASVSFHPPALILAILGSVPLFDIFALNQLHRILSVEIQR